MRIVVNNLSKSRRKTSSFIISYFLMNQLEDTAP